MNTQRTEIYRSNNRRQSIVESASTVFERQGDLYYAVKTREGDLVRGGVYSESFVKHYASVTENVAII